MTGAGGAGGAGAGGAGAEGAGAEGAGTGGADMGSAGAEEASGPGAEYAGADDAGGTGGTGAEDGHGAEADAGGEAARGGVVVLDCLGQKCPLPVIALARQIRNVRLGGVVRVLADDPAAANDIPAWCRMKEQEFLGSPAPYAFEVRRIS